MEIAPQEGRAAKGWTSIGTVVGNTSTGKYSFILRSFQAKLGDIVATRVEVPDAAGTAQRTVTVWGRVVAIDRAAGRITLEFRPIPQLLLEGGTRIFAVKDPVSLKGLGPGDKVRFEVERNGLSYLVTRVENRN